MADVYEEQFTRLVSAVFEVYVSCFCPNDDLLSQWRGYPSAGGYAIGFRSSALVAGGGLMRQIIYDRSTQLDLVRKAITPLCDALRGKPPEKAQHFIDLAVTSHLGAVGSYLVECSCSFKNVGFKEESEWRLIWLRIRDPTLVPDEVTKEHPNVRATGLGLVPFVKRKLVDDPEGNRPVADVVVGPTSHPALAARAAIQELTRTGYYDAESMVRPSQIPLRP